jgi:ABC-type transport system involved in multi-copper enzyme maturation permease subunit
LTQTWAIFVDAYRELNSKRLFWIVLALSGLVVGAFAMLGNNEEGITFLHWTIPFDIASTRFVPTDQFYKITFVSLGLSIWLTWIATVLALVSTAGIFPDFLAGGSIELALSKPISRLRLFLTKYLSGLLFVFLQVLVFSGASFLVIGFRGGSWEPAILLSVPLVVLVFSYLYAVLVLVGVLWRSTIAALLVTLLVWFVIFAINSADGVMLQIKHESRLSVREEAAQVDAVRARIAELEKQAAQPDSPAPEPATEEAEAKPTEGGLAAALAWGLRKSGQDAERNRTPDERLVQVKQELSSKQAELDSSSKTLATVERWHGIVVGVKTVLPKTGETVGLMERYILDLSKLRSLQSDRRDERQAEIVAEMSEEGVAGDRDEMRRRMDREEQVANAVRDEMRGRNELWIIGTSLLFEALVMGLAAWSFCRREF